MTTRQSRRPVPPRGVRRAFAFALLIAGCHARSESPPRSTAAPASATQPGHRSGFYGGELRLRVGETADFEDGLEVRVEQIEDARCPPTVVCVWQGEIDVTLRVANASPPAEVHLGTFTRPEDSLDGYSFHLARERVTPAEVALTVRKTERDGSPLPGKSSEGG
jgi:hypothetical protein